MMKRLIDLETDEDFAEFSEILSKVKEGNIVGTIKQAILGNDGNYKFVDLQQCVSDSKVMSQLNGDYFYIIIEGLRHTDVYNLKTMYNTVLQRGTHNFKQGKENDYIFTVDVGKSELHKGFTYVISGVAPIFVSSDGDSDLTFVFALENMRCVKEEVSMYDIEYDVAMLKERDDEAYHFVLHDDDDDETTLTEDFNENENFIGTRDYISGDKFI